MRVCVRILNFAKHICPIKTIKEKMNREYKLCTQFLFLPICLCSIQSHIWPLGQNVDFYEGTDIFLKKKMFNLYN